MNTFDLNQNLHHLSRDELQKLLQPSKLELHLAPAVGESADPRNILSKNAFRVALDVHQFQPNEIHVKTEKNRIIVEGNHEDREDDLGWVARKFTR